MLPFLETLADSLIGGKLISGWPDSDLVYSLSTATIYLPTKRSADRLAKLIQLHTKAQAAFIPKIITIGDIDEDLKNIADEDAVDKLLAANSVVPEISPLKRRLILTKLILAWAKQLQFSLDDNSTGSLTRRSLNTYVEVGKKGFSVGATINDGLALSDALGYLIDTLVIYKKTWQDVHLLLPQDLSDEYWRISKDFLKIAAEAWPKYCKQEGVMDAAERRDLIISKEAERLSANQPQTPFIIAGSTGSMPSTAKLIRSISQLPYGAVILPGIDQYIDNESWEILTDKKDQTISAGHPQAQLSKLINLIGVRRQDVVALSQTSKTLGVREIFLSECMRPSDTTHLWATRDQRLSEAQIRDAISGISIIEAENEREEALAVAMALRSALEVPGKTAALITPDRSLARRVSAELLRWNIFTNDSAGTPLHQTSIGSLTSLLATAIIERFSSISLLSLLNHPDATFGLNPDIVKRGIKTIDIGLCRSPLSSQDIDGLLMILKAVRKSDWHDHEPLPKRRLTSDDWNAAGIILEKIRILFEPFRNLQNTDVREFFNLLAKTLKIVVSSIENIDRIYYLDGSTELHRLFDTIQNFVDLDLNVPISSYPSLVERLMAPETLSNQSPSHPRINILGLLEARLLRFDLVILGGLDEGIWPPEGRSDPFLNRPWREELGLPTPERRIGQTAHDFISALGVDEVIITRALKRAGSPTIASRFIQRINAVAGEVIFKSMIQRGQNILKHTGKIDEADLTANSSQPRPVPPQRLLPKKLSVTEIETLRRDPYSIYAKHVLKLDKLENIGYMIGARERGNLYHLILARFSEKWPFTLPDDPLKEFFIICDDILSSDENQIMLDAFEKARLRETGNWYIQWEQLRRKYTIAPIAVERRGALTVVLPRGGQFTLSGQADRIELLDNGEFCIIDYKTGAIPSRAQVQTGFSPQLTLEAAMLKRNAFSGLSGFRTRDLIYVKIGSKTGGDESSAKNSKSSADYDTLVEQHFSEFIKLIDDHWNGSRPFYSRPHLQFSTDSGKYDHLARFYEWALIRDDAEIGDDE